MDIEMPDRNMRRLAMQYNIEFENEADTIYFALVAKYEKMIDDLRTRYDNAPNWTDVEDGAFLREEIAKIRILVSRMYGVDLPRR